MLASVLLKRVASLTYAVLHPVFSDQNGVVTMDIGSRVS